MRKRYNRIVWKSRSITIQFLTDQLDLAASTKKYLSKDEFINNLVQFLIEDGYSPRMPVNVMKQQMKSPYSESESYYFLKIDESGVRIKLVLDIRWSTHPLNEYGNYTGADRKLYNMNTKQIPDIGKETGLDVTDTKSKFIDVVQEKTPIFDLVKVDDQFYNNYNEALDAIYAKVKTFDSEIKSESNQ